MAGSLVQQVFSLKNPAVDDRHSDPRAIPAVRQRQLGSNRRIGVVQRCVDLTVRRDKKDARTACQSFDSFGWNGDEHCIDQPQVRLPNAAKLIDSAALLAIRRTRELNYYVHNRIGVDFSQVRSDLRAFPPQPNR